MWKMAPFLTFGCFHRGKTIAPPTWYYYFFSFSLFGCETRKQQSCRDVGFCAKLAVCGCTFISLAPPVHVAAHVSCNVIRSRKKFAATFFFVCVSSLSIHVCVFMYGKWCHNLLTIDVIQSSRRVNNKLSASGHKCNQHTHFFHWRISYRYEKRPAPNCVHVEFILCARQFGMVCLVPLLALWTR